MSSRLIDVREYPEFAEGHIEGSELVPLGTLNKASENWDRSEPLTLVCRSGRRSIEAKKPSQQRVLRTFGYSKVVFRPGATAESRCP